MKRNHVSVQCLDEFNANQSVFVPFRKDLRKASKLQTPDGSIEKYESSSSHRNNEFKNESDKRHQFRLQAIDEIFQSEKSYLKQLKNLLDSFIVPLKQINIIDGTTQMILFGHIEMIYNLNNELFSILRTDLDNVAKAFLKMAPFFKLYSVYAFDYKNAILTLQELMEKNSKFKAFLDKAETKAETKLNSLMIAPIQRVPRYKLLLEQVLLYTSPADPDCKILKESIREIECTVSHIDSVIEDQEATQTLLNLQNSLVNNVPSIIKPGRKVIKEGVLNKVTRTGSQIKRYCILMSDLFMYCKILKDRPKYGLIENSLECCCIFPLKKCKIFEMFPGNFKISCQGDGLILSTTDSHSAKCWIGAIRDAIDMYIECRKTLRKESSKRKPMRKRYVKNFDLHVVNEGKKSDFETIYRGAGSLDDEETLPKNSLANFWTNRIPRLMKRKPDNAYAIPTFPTSKVGVDKLWHLSKSSASNNNTPSKLDSSKNKSSVEPSEDLDPGFGFAGEYIKTKSYFRTNSVDNILSGNSIQESNLGSPCIGDIATICDHFSPAIISSRSKPDYDCIPKKKKKCSLDQIQMEFNPFYEQPGTNNKTDTIDRYYKEKPFDFTPSYGEKGKLKDRIINFFSTLF